MTTESYSVHTIRDYLLGQLPESEAERLDELSITDDEFVERIRGVEHDLVDAFARGELQGVVLERFRSNYLTTPRRREAIRFAAALQSLDDSFAHDSSSEPVRVPPTLGREKGRWRERLALAAAVTLLASASAWLVRDNRTLRARATDAESARDALLRDRRTREVESRRSADTAQQLASPAPAPLAVLVLAPQLRGARQFPTMALGGDAGDLAVQLDLEPVDYPEYNAALVASKDVRPVWRSERLIARTVGSRKTIDVRLPATVLNPQDYLIRVSGVGRGAAEVVGEYRFTVVK